jgi:hypothetical protein
LSAIIQDLISQFPFILIPVAIIFILSPLLRILLSFLSSSKSIKLKNLELLHTITQKKEELTGGEKLILEQLFYNMYKIKVDHKTIFALLESKSPIESIQLFKTVNHYLKTSNGIRYFRSSKNYQRIKIGKMKLMYMQRVKEFAFYMLFMMSGLFCLMVIAYVISNWPEAIIMQIFSGGLCIALVLMTYTFMAIAVKLLLREGMKGLESFLKLQGVITKPKRGTNFSI